MKGLVALACLAGCDPGDSSKNTDEQSDEARADEPTRPEPEPEPELDPEPEPTATSPDEPPVAHVPDGLAELAAYPSTPAPVRVEPAEAGDGHLPESPTDAIDPDTGTFMEHPQPFGWSAKGDEFGMCWAIGTECRTCAFAKPNGAADVMNEHNEGPGDEECDAAKTKELDVRLAAGGFGKKKAPTWRYGKEVVVTWKTSSRGEPPVLEIGARVDGAERTAKLLELTSAEPATDFFPEVIVLDPGQRHFALVTHAWEGEHSDTFSIQFVQADRVAAKAYRAAGFAGLEAKSYDDAAKHFGSMTAVDGADWKGPFNMACALSLGGKKDQARLALEEAFVRGGDFAKNKAKKDKDLDNVRGEAWFAELLEKKFKPPVTAAALESKVVRREVRPIQKREALTELKKTGVPACDRILELWDCGFAEQPADPPNLREEVYERFFELVETEGPKVAGESCAAAVEPMTEFFKEEYGCE